MATRCNTSPKASQLRENSVYTGPAIPTLRRTDDGVTVAVSAPPANSEKFTFMIQVLTNFPTRSNAPRLGFQTWKAAGLAGGETAFGEGTDIGNARGEGGATLDCSRQGRKLKIGTTNRSTDHRRNMIPKHWDIVGMFGLEFEAFI